MYTSFSEIIAALHGSADRKRMVAAWGVDGHTIAAAAEAVKQGIADVTLVGDRDMISKASLLLGCGRGDFHSSRREHTLGHADRVLCR